MSLLKKIFGKQEIEAAKTTVPQVKKDNEQALKSDNAEEAEEAQNLPDKPYGPKIASITNKGIEYYWKKVEKADGYEIFRSYDEEGDFEKIAVIKTKKKGEYIDADFIRDKKTVYYKSRSYFDLEDGEKAYSEFTKTVAAVFREEMLIERSATYMYDGAQRHIKAFYGWGEVEDPIWGSKNEAVATISQGGIITAVSKGEAIITCTSEKIGETAEAKVVVNRDAPEILDTGKRRYSYNEATGCWENVNKKTTNDAIIMMVGDMMCGSVQTKRQYNEENGWKYNDSYEYVRRTTAKSDFAIGNLETLMAAGWPYMIDEAYIDNKNNCNNPSRYLDAVLYGGFDAVTMSNNHNCDGGIRALIETIDQTNLRNIPNTGIFKTPEDDRYMIININGIKVGFVAYMSKATTFNGKDAGWTQEEKNTHLNVFSEEKSAEDIKMCKAAGAEYIIAYMHWGRKNYRNITEDQKKEAFGIANAGADYIVGANPHVVQVYDEIISNDGRSVPCFYSTGNFQAFMNQIPGNRDSVMVRIRLKRDREGQVKLAENTYIPYHTYKLFEGCNLAPISTGTIFDQDIKVPGRKKYGDRVREAIGGKVKAL